MSSCNIMRISSNKNLSITGLVAPSPAVYQFLFVMNVDANNSSVWRSCGVNN